MRSKACGAPRERSLGGLFKMPLDSRSHASPAESLKTSPEIQKLSVFGSAAPSISNTVKVARVQGGRTPRYAMTDVLGFPGGAPSNATATGVSERFDTVIFVRTSLSQLYHMVTAWALALSRLIWFSRDCASWSSATSADLSVPHAEIARPTAATTAAITAVCFAQSVR